MFTKFFFSISYKSYTWICNINGIQSFSVFEYFIDNNKMILIPMNYARQWTFTNKSIEPQTTSYCFNPTLPLTTNFNEFSRVAWT